MIAHLRNVWDMRRIPPPTSVTVNSNDADLWEGQPDVLAPELYVLLGVDERRTLCWTALREAVRDPDPTTFRDRVVSGLGARLKAADQSERSSLESIRALVMRHPAHVEDLRRQLLAVVELGRQVEVVNALRRRFEVERS